MKTITAVYDDCTVDKTKNRQQKLKKLLTKLCKSQTKKKKELVDRVQYSYK